jgi:hypothetical protein
MSLRYAFQAFAVVVVVTGAVAHAQGIINLSYFAGAIVWRDTVAGSGETNE